MGGMKQPTTNNNREPKTKVQENIKKMWGMLEKIEKYLGNISFSAKQRKNERKNSGAGYKCFLACVFFEWGPKFSFTKVPKINVSGINCATSAERRRAKKSSLSAVSD